MSKNGGGFGFWIQIRIRIDSPTKNINGNIKEYKGKEANFDICLIPRKEEMFDQS